MKSTLIKHGFLAGTLLGLPLVTHAYDFPTVNLGMTSFLDGGLP
ncbi:phenol degradation protein meta, partial [Acinetobacter baumannii]|nr:phenol degradation protein meta [Acinetobacter baumannii]